MSMTPSILFALSMALAAPAALSAQQADTVELRSAPPPNLRWRAVGAAAAAVALTALFDPTIARTAAGHQSDRLTRVSDNLDRFGEVSVIAPVLIGTAAVGLIARQPELLRLSVRTATAITFVTAVGQATKFAVGRKRPFQDADLGGTDFDPFGGGSTSFPSGHTAAAFALATTLGDAIGDPVARVGLYALATATGAARIALQKHWASDVVAGAALGVLGGKFAAGKVRLFGLRAPRMLVTPDAVVTGFSVPLPRVR